MAVEEIPISYLPVLHRMVSRSELLFCSLSLSVVYLSVKPKSTWQLLRPHFETLVSSFVFPQMSFTPAKQELWENDPVDYVRISVGRSSPSSLTLCRFYDVTPSDEYENFASPVSAATSFLLSLASSRTKVTFMPILTFINSVLRSYVSPYLLMFLPLL